MAQFIESLCSSIPPSVLSAQTLSEARFAYTINEYQLHRVDCFFMTPSSRDSGLMKNRLKDSQVVVWTVSLGLRLFQASNRDLDGAATEGPTNINVINQLEQKILSTLNGNTSLKGMADHLMAQLELAFIGFVTSGCALGYHLLRRARPGFLRLAATDPGLMVERSNGHLFVSFPRILNIVQQELSYFILYDLATAFALGLPPLLDYDYDHNGECSPSFQSFQFVHGAPAIFVEILSQVNSWRAGATVTLDDWWVLEGRAMAWQAQSLEAQGGDLKGNAARLTVQESWRHITLVYIYMGVCGVSSHDPRVQEATTQILRLGESIIGEAVSMHMLAHYVVVGMAGVGAQHEYQRSAIRRKLLSKAFRGKRAWLFRGPEFSRVLDHLWQGAGAGGAPVTWDDYVWSRCAVLPI
ncbi:unnamed protein product [Rhizoctonia solani]|uniref:Uncharacterized protein n=1 Tax=Rhizoctonia solani TaxID=456999 RepID=A0A8H2XZX9_9AGAM|nr:unnamed protein product [Rhizoctonia solani]